VNQQKPSLADLAAAHRNDASNSWWGADLTGDNLTHHLVPRTAGMTCTYCKVVNASTDEVCPVRVEKEGA
jgi:hypothetical protein